MPRSVLKAADNIQANGPSITTATAISATYVATRPITRRRGMRSVVVDPHALEPVLAERQREDQHECGGGHGGGIADLEELKGIVDDVLDQGLCGVVGPALGHHHHRIENVQSINQRRDDYEECRG